MVYLATTGKALTKKSLRDNQAASSYRKIEPRARLFLINMLGRCDVEALSITRQKTEITSNRNRVILVYHIYPR